MALLALAACGGGGGGGGSSGAVTGLQGPEQVTIVEAQSGSATLRLAPGTAAAGLTDYQAAQTRFWVKDESMEALDIVNEILGYLHETNYWDPSVVNQGPYIAMVTQENRGGDGRGDSGPSYEEWIVDSTRADNAAPQLVKFWIRSEDDGQAQIIYGLLTVEEEPTDQAPLGVFLLRFKQLDVSQAHDDPDIGFFGYMRSVRRTDGQTEIEFYMGEGDINVTPAVGERAVLQRMHVIGDPATDSGRGFVEVQGIDNWSGTPHSFGDQYYVQFDADYLARRRTSDDQIAVLDRNDFETNVFHYGVYLASTEDRVDLAGGFPVETQGGAHGYVGYWGMWFPESVTIGNGDTLVRRRFQNGMTTTSNYTAVIAPGRLEKRTRSSITLGDIVDEDMDAFSPSLGQEIRVRWTGNDLVCTALRSNGDWMPITPPTSVVNQFTPGQWAHFWSQARGSIEFTWPVTLDNSVQAYVWSNTTITAASPELAGGDLMLHGYSHMLRAGITSNQANYQNSETPYFAAATNPGEGQTYVFDRDTLMLTLGGTPVTLADGVSVTQGPGMFGFDCGPMFATALGSLSEMATQTTTYQWFTGQNHWNQLRTIKDENGAFVAFDEPLRFTYTHDEPGSPFHGRTFYLDWNGEHLGGIPGEQDSETGWWRPLLNIPTGTTLTSGSTSYKVKQLEGEQTMVEVADPTAVISARGYDLTTTVSVPDASAWSDPAIGARPTVTDPPRFVGGIAQ